MLPKPFSRILFATVAIALPGCNPSRDAGPPQEGRFELSRTGEDGGVVIASGATAAWCARDTLLTIVALDAKGAGGMAAVVGWPLTDAQTLRAGPFLSGAGTATVTWRSLADSVRTALLADSGFVALQGDELVSGTLSVSAMRDTVLVRLEGRFADIPVHRTCPGDAGP